MSISKIKTGSITTDAITEAKVADNAIENEHLNSNVITGQTELSASAATDDVLLVYDTSAGVIKKIAASNVGLQQPAISSISPTNVLSGDGTGNYTFTITGTGFLEDATAKLTTDGGTDISFDTVTRNSSTQLTCVVAKNTANLTNANEPFDVTVTTAGALTGTSADAITIDASPVFVTNTGSIGSVLEETSGSFSVNATDPESGAAVTFELQSGSLPPGFSITNTAADGGTAIISGTAPTVAANTTYNFTLRAVDSASNVSSRAFSITVTNNPVSESFTSSGTFSVPAGTTVVDVLVVAAGAGGGNDHGGGGGAGGLIFFPEYPVTPGGTVSVTVGCGGATGSPGGSKRGASGQDSVFGTLTAKGGGGGGGGNTDYNGGPGGSGGGGSGHGQNALGTTNTGGSATQPTQPGNSGAYGFGSSGGPGVNPGAGTQLYSGGGGGAGTAGGPGTGTGQCGSGGNGKAYTIADGTTPVYYAGGGGGSHYNSGYTLRPGGQGGGGAGVGSCEPAGAQNGQANKGGGGGGGPGGGDGGKGIVIVRY